MFHLLRDRTLGGTQHYTMHKFYSMLYIYYLGVTILTHSISYSSPLRTGKQYKNFTFHMIKIQKKSKNFVFPLNILSWWDWHFVSTSVRESLEFNSLLKFRIQCSAWIVSHFQNIFLKCLNRKEDNIFKNVVKLKKTK